MNTSDQLDFFEDQIQYSTSYKQLEIEYIKDFFNKNESDILFNLLKKDIEWKQDFIQMYGKSYPLPRLTAWYGDKNKRYTYSGITMKPLSWTRELLKIRRKLEVFSQQEFNSVLLNYYRSGNDSGSWHSDDEEELGKLPIIGSLSFGGVRRFRFRNKRNKNLSQTYELQNGSLLLMKGATQKFWEHEVPKTKKKVKGRINLTFRFIV